MHFQHRIIMKKSVAAESNDSGLLEGTPYFGLQRKILQDIARKKSKLNVVNDAKDPDISKNKTRKTFDKSIENRVRDSLKSTTTKRKISEISPQQVNSDNSSEVIPKKRTILAVNGSPEGTDKQNTARSSQSNSSASSSAASDSKYSNDRTIYIQGLPFSATEDEVRTLFEPCGKIASIRLPRWHDSGRIKGYGHVEFNDNSSATKALDLSGEYIQDRYITVDRPQTPRSVQAQESGKVVVEKPVGCRRIFVKNLPYEVTDEDIREAFKVFGPITNIRLAMWGHTGNLKGGTLSISFMHACTYVCMYPCEFDPRFRIRHFSFGPI